jgi:hypothetical protein
MAAVPTLPPASDAWRETDQPGERRFLSLGRCTTQSGFLFAEVRVTEQSRASLQPEHSNAIDFAHAFTCHSHVCGTAGPGHATRVDGMRWSARTARSRPVAGGAQGTSSVPRCQADLPRIPPSARRK